ncbi:SsgA family sporulation/cell division regulator [Actinacidiphila alni]|uniref:SsgA family sporulation/cell division regulator n=1 Tax=Actinacidiphila alni TaxID=380248 RepID=UPI003408C127
MDAGQGPSPRWIGHRTVGEADVRVWSRGCTGGKNRGFLYLLLSSPVGDALMRFDRGEVRPFLQRSRQIVECGDEHLHTDVQWSELEAN